MEIAISRGLLGRQYSEPGAIKWPTESLEKEVIMRILRIFNFMAIFTDSVGYPCVGMQPTYIVLTWSTTDSLLS